MKVLVKKKTTTGNKKSYRQKALDKPI